jgi:23S rRNA (guanosine2251-2'-O)-methyltransferase
MVKQGAGGGFISSIRRDAKERGVPVQFVPEARLNRMAGGASHQGIAAITAPVPYLELDDMLLRIAADTDEVREKQPILLLLDGIQDPYNFGAILEKCRCSWCRRSGDSASRDGPA